MPSRFSFLNHPVSTASVSCKCSGLVHGSPQMSCVPYLSNMPLVASIPPQAICSPPCCMPWQGLGWRQHYASSLNNPSDNFPFYIGLFGLLLLSCHFFIYSKTIPLHDLWNPPFPIQWDIFLLSYFFKVQKCFIWVKAIAAFVFLEFKQIVAQSKVWMIPVFS